MIHSIHNYHPFIMLKWPDIYSFAWLNSAVVVRHPLFLVIMDFLISMYITGSVGILFSCEQKPRCCTTYSSSFLNKYLQLSTGICYHVFHRSALQNYWLLHLYVHEYMFLQLLLIHHTANCRSSDYSYCNIGCYTLNCHTAMMKKKI